MTQSVIVYVMVVVVSSEVVVTVVGTTWLLVPLETNPEVTIEDEVATVELATAAVFGDREVTGEVLLANRVLAPVLAPPGVTVVVMLIVCWQDVDDDEESASGTASVTGALGLGPALVTGSLPEATAEVVAAGVGSA